RLTSVVLGLSRGSDGALLEPHDELVAAAAPAVTAVPDVGRDFRNAADTDPSCPTNRAWGRKILARVAASQLGVETIGAAAVGDLPTLDAIIARVQATGAAWGRQTRSSRACRPREQRGAG
ncbi:hypothetical protein AB4Z22_46300, partial [Paenibacillus sp. TAF58]